jgi:hypothetical protein
MAKLILTVAVLEKVAGQFEAVLATLYGAGVAMGTDGDWGTVAAAVETFKTAAADRAAAQRKAETEAARKVTERKAAPVAAEKPAVKATKRTAAARTVKAETVKAEKPAKATKRPTCKGVKADGGKCGCTVLVADGFCRSHKSQAGKAERIEKATKSLEKKATKRTAETVKTVAAATVAAPTVKAEKVPTAGTVLVADGKGGFRKATEADLWAALEKLGSGK